MPDFQHSVQPDYWSLTTNLVVDDYTVDKRLVLLPYIKKKQRHSVQCSLYKSFTFLPGRKLFPTTAASVTLHLILKEKNKIKIFIVCDTCNTITFEEKKKKSDCVVQPFFDVCSA